MEINGNLGLQFCHEQFYAESKMAVDAVLMPLEAEVVTMRTKQGVKMGLPAQVLIICSGSSPDTQSIERELAYDLILSA